MHEENFLSSWLRHDLTGKERKVSERVGEEVENNRKREEEKTIEMERKKEDETVNRRCVSSSLAEAFDTICANIITDLTRYRPIVLELI